MRNYSVLLSLRPFFPKTNLQAKFDLCKKPKAIVRPASIIAFFAISGIYLFDNVIFPSRKGTRPKIK